MEIKNTHQGQLLYLDDAFEVTLTASATASAILSVDSRCTVTLLGALTATDYQIQVSNINPQIKTALPSVTGTGPFTSGGGGNQYPTPENIVWSINPELEASWITLTAFNAAGYVIVDGYFRLIRIMNTVGFDADTKAFVFAEKLSPVIQ